MTNLPSWIHADPDPQPCFFACLKDAAGAALKQAAPAPAPGSDQKKKTPAPQHWFLSEDFKIYTKLKVQNLIHYFKKLTQIDKIEII